MPLRNQNMRLLTRAADGIRFWQWNAPEGQPPLSEIVDASLEPSERPVAYATSAPILAALQSDHVAVTAFPRALHGTDRPFVKVRVPLPPLPVSPAPRPTVDVSPRGSFLILTFIINRVGVAEVDHPNTFIYDISSILDISSSVILPEPVAVTPTIDESAETPDIIVAPSALPANAVRAHSFDDVPPPPLVAVTRVSAPRLFEWDLQESFLVFRTQSAFCVHRAVSGAAARAAFVARGGDAVVASPTGGAGWAQMRGPSDALPRDAASGVAYDDLSGLVTLADTTRTTLSVPLPKSKALVRYSISSGARPRVAIFGPPAKADDTANARILVYALDQLGGTPQLDVHVPAADEAQITWAQGGAAAVIVASSRDKTEVNYKDFAVAYILKAGSTNGVATVSLLPLDASWPLPKQQEKDLRGLQQRLVVAQKATGSIHSVAWAPDGKKLAVIHGQMPDPTVSLFTPTGQIDKVIASGPFNMLSWSPNSQFLFITGSEGLSDTWRVYEMSALLLDKTKVPTVRNTSIKAAGERASTVVCPWAPDGRAVILATTAPRMMVDNGFVLQQHNGAVLMKKSFQVRHA